MKLYVATFILLSIVNLTCSQECKSFQSSVISDLKKHSLFFWVDAKWTADLSLLGKKAANLSNYIDEVSPPSSPSNQKIIGGVGFGEKFYNEVFKKHLQFKFVDRTGVHGSMPATGGDIFVHAKSDSYTKLFELAQKLLKEFGRTNLASYEDTYGFVYKDGRDLSGFIDGTENPVTPAHRRRVAVDCKTGGSFVLTQRWVHDMEHIEKQLDKHMEDVIGRTKEDSIELEPLPPCSHVARMTKDTSRPVALEIVRQSMPYGTLTGEAGLFFISYANSTKNTDFMLDNMVGKSNGKDNDMVMTISKAVSGNYWYFPGVDELKSF